jgi:hypothetical protein
MTGVTVELEDRGQDFLEFDIENRVIVDTRPFQGWVWNGRKVVNETFGVGDCLTRASETGKLTLKYPVVAIREMEARHV